MLTSFENSMTDVTKSTEKSFPAEKNLHRPAAPVEIELKFELEPAAAAQLRLHPALAGQPANSKRQRTVYFDTPDGAVRKAGFSLRVRSSGDRFIQTVKPLAASAGLFARSEWEVDVAALEPDRARLVATPLVELASAGALEHLSPIIDSEVTRTSWTVGDHGGRIQVDLDEGRIAAGGAEETLCEVELELVAGEPRQVLALARSLAEVVPMRIGVLTKAERGFALADGSAGKVSKAGPVAVSAEMSVAEGFATIAHACLKHFRLNEGLVIRERDASALHQSRVAMRRLRSALSLFRRVVADDAFGLLRDELRWFTAQLGEGRNLDVYLQRQDIPQEQRGELGVRREAVYEAIVGSLESQRFRLLTLDIVAWLEAGHWRSGPKAQRALKPFARKRLNALWRRVEGYGDDLSHLDEDTRHELRIEIKKLRYALEFFDELFREDRSGRKRFAAEVEGLQEALGLLNDIVTARQLTAATGVEDEGWLVVQPPEQERQLLHACDRHLHQLRKVGRYWMEGAPREAAMAESGAAGED